jgi:deferrochelatase/peroxidase EfeB
VARINEWEQEAGANGGLWSKAFRLVKRLDAQLQDKEPFGFRDGLSQPFIRGTDRGASRLPDDAHRVPSRDQIAAGEFIFGYANEFGVRPESPRVAAGLDQADKHLPDAIELGYKDLGRNGTFLVARELEQDTAKFEARFPDGEADAARLVGRWKDGTSLVVRPPALDGSQPEQPRTPSLRDFTYYAEDAAGLRCPLGSHVRRANPRDALTNAVQGVLPEDAIAEANKHRILRRGRVFKEKAADGKVRTGILFQCINTNLLRQFEFVQQTWVNNPKFNGLDAERDPLVGSGPSNVPHELLIAGGPQRRKLEDLSDYVTVRGGAYFFLPSYRALSYLAELGRGPQARQEPAAAGSPSASVPAPSGGPRSPQQT